MIMSSVTINVSDSNLVKKCVARDGRFRSIMIYCLLEHFTFSDVNQKHLSFRRYSLILLDYRYLLYQPLEFGQFGQ